jgi:elongation factor Ts
MLRFTSILRQVTAAQRKSAIMELRKTSGFSLGQSQKALKANNYNIDDSMKWLTKQAKKEGWTKMKALAGRKAVEGYCCVSQNEESLVLFELNCETDFVARTPGFSELVNDVGEHLLTSGEKDVNSEATKEIIAKKVFSIRENLSLARMRVFEKKDGVSFGVHVHNPVQVGDNTQGGRFAVVVKGEAGKSGPSVLNQVAQHIMASNPTKMGKWKPEEFKKLKIADDITDEEKAAKQFTKINPDETRLYYQEHCTQGVFTVGNYLAEDGAKISEYVRFQLGETNK